MEEQSNSQEWDDSVHQLGGGILQSSAWAKFQQTCGRRGWRDQGDGWLWQAFGRKSRGISYLMAPYGPIINNNAAKALDSIVRAGRARGVDFVRLEPIGEIGQEAIKQFGGRPIHALEPEATLILDLTQPEEVIKSGLSSSHRNRVNTATKRGLEVKASDDPASIEIFLRLMHDTARHAQITNFPDWYYRKMAEILIPLGVAKFYIAYGEGKPVSCSLIYDWGGCRYYAHTGNDQALNRHYKASVYSVWTMILEAKAAGLERFDFWGIAPNDNPNHPWAGITAFKKAFGGEEVHTLGTWDIPVKKTKYGIYSAYRRLRRMDVNK